MGTLAPGEGADIRTAVLIGLTALALCLGGCTAAESSDTLSSGIPTPAATASAAPTVQPQTSAPDSADLVRFRTAIQSVWAGSDNMDDQAYVDALVAAGFQTSAMQITSDTMTSGEAAESLQVAVLVDTECLVGQVGPSTGDPVVAVLPVLPTGGCLIGQTHPIDG